MTPPGSLLAEQVLVMLLIADSMTSLAECYKSPSGGSSSHDVDVAKSSGREVGELNDLLRLLDSLHDVRDMLEKLRLELDDIHQQQHAMKHGLQTMGQRLQGIGGDVTGQGQDVDQRDPPIEIGKTIYFTTLLSDVGDPHWPVAT